MKTNVVLKSEDRNLFGVVIRQETKTGFLNLSDLQSAYNLASLKFGWSDKKFDHLLYQKENIERIFYLLEKQNYIKLPFNNFMEMVENESPAKLLKRIGAYKTTGARQTKTVYCDPYLWVLLAMEMNPKFYSEVITWLTDTLILNRIEAGNFYKTLTAAIRKWNPNGDHYIKLAKALNYIIFNKHEAGIRNISSSKELKELEELERNMAFAIDMGFIKSFDELLNYLRKIYYDKYRKYIN